jgi:hypothetical protein
VERILLKILVRINIYRTNGEVDTYRNTGEG